MKLIIRWVITALALVVAVGVVPGLRVEGDAWVAYAVTAASVVFLAAGVALTRSPVESTPASSVCGRAARFALVSWLLAIGGVVVALVGGVRSEPDR